MKFIDLFSGIGGFRRGLERSGHTCAGHVEIDNYANKSYMAMYELVPCKYSHGQHDNGCMMCKSEVSKNCAGKECKGEWYAKDITKIRAGEIPKAEIWTFGFPCTDISLSGRRAGLHGKRSGLFFEVARLLQSKSPKDRPYWIIVENVKYLLSIEGGGAFTAVLTELSQVGYDLQWQVLNSKGFAVPQHRERVYLVGHLRERGGREIFPLGRTNGTPVKQMIGGMQGDRLYDPSGLSITLVSNAGGFGGKTGLYAIPSFVDMNVNPKFTPEARCIRARQNAGVTNHKGEASGVIVESSIKFPCATSIDMNEGGELTEYARCIKARQYAGVSNHNGETSGIFLCHGKPYCVRAVITPNRENKRQNGRRFKEIGEPSFTLTCQDQHGVLLCCCEGWKEGCANSNVSRGRVGKQCSQTILTGGNMRVLICCRIRRLTPRECFRLQAFDDLLFDRAKAAGISDAQLYKQAGNAVTVNIVYEIGLKLSMMEKKDEI